MKKQEFLTHSSEHVNEMLTSLLGEAYDVGFEQATQELQKDGKENITIHFVDQCLFSAKNLQSLIKTQT